MRLYSFFIIIFSFFSLSQNLYAQMAQTPHNLSGISDISIEDNEMCIFCHTPHKTATMASVPLWNKIPSDTEFTIYGSVASQSHAPNNPNSYSMICLSCHDGASSINSVVNAPGNVGFDDSTPKLIRPSRSISIGLSGGLKDNHPVSVLYIPGKAGLKPIYEPLIGEWKDATYIYDLLRNGRVECGSCHDPHFADPDGIFLRNKNKHSELCLSCHDK